MNKPLQCFTHLESLPKDSFTKTGHKEERIHIIGLSAMRRSLLRAAAPLKLYQSHGWCGCGWCCPQVTWSPGSSQVCHMPILQQNQGSQFWVSGCKFPICPHLYCISTSSAFWCIFFQAALDFLKVPYDSVEVDPLTRSQIKFSKAAAAAASLRLRFGWFFFHPPGLQEGAHRGVCGWTGGRRLHQDRGQSGWIRGSGKNLDGKWTWKHGQGTLKDAGVDVTWH